MNNELLINITSYLNSNGEKEIWKLLYLIEWKYLLVNNKRLFEGVWKYTLSGAVLQNIDLRLIKSKNIEMDEKYLNYINFVLEKKERLSYTDFANMYYSTYPLMNTSKGDFINLFECRKNYIKTLSQDKKNSILSLDTFLEKNKKKQIDKKYFYMFGSLVVSLIGIYIYL